MAIIEASPIGGSVRVGNRTLIDSLTANGSKTEEYVYVRADAVTGESVFLALTIEEAAEFESAFGRALSTSRRTRDIKRESR